MFSIITLFWFIRTSKIFLFWLYFWQLKEYHTKRLFAHFSTHKGKKLILDPLLFLKLGLVAGFFLSETVFFIFPLILFLLYFTETLFFLRSFFGKKIKRPVLTKKTAVIIFVGFLILFCFPLVLFLLVKNLFWFCFGLLVFDILTPKITSILVLFFQPLVFIWQKRILKKAAKKISEKKNLKVIGITGSFGKTSTKEFLATVLSQKFNVLKTKEHQNSEIGIARCILDDLKEEHEIFVCEIGAYDKGKIKEVSEIIQPQIGILTGINQQHIATFGSQKNVIEAKYELIENLPKNGIAFFNGENKYCRELFEKTKKRKKLYKFSDAEDIEIRKESVSFKHDSINFKVNVLGKGILLNILGVISIAQEMGISLKKIAEGFQKITEEQLGTTIKKTNKGLNIIDSSYSANPTGVLSHLEHLKLWQGKKVIVMPCLIELGGESKKIHQKIGEKIGKVCDSAYITTKERFGQIKKAALKAGMNKKEILFLSNPYRIFEKIKVFRGKEDIILLEGRVSNKLLDLLK